MCIFRWNNRKMPVQMILSVTGVKYTNGDGYYYRLSQKLHNKLYLNCQLRSCRVRGIGLLFSDFFRIRYKYYKTIFVHFTEIFSPGNVPADYDKDDRIVCKGSHNHPPDLYETEFCELERRILERSANEVLPLRRIFLEETTG